MRWLALAGYGSCCRISPHKDLLLLRTGEAMYWGQFDFHRQSCLLFPLKISWKNEHLLNHLKNNLGLFKRWQQLLRSIYRGLLSAHGVLSASHGLTQFTKNPKSGPGCTPGSQAQQPHAGTLDQPAWRRSDSSSAHRYFLCTSHLHQLHR